MDGVIAAVPTPIDADRAPLQALFDEHCRWALANGCDGLNILGSTGEANSLPHGARRQVMGWAASACPRERLMVGTGTPSLDETIALTEAADDLGYSTALVLPPYYYKPAQNAGLMAWYRALNEALKSRKIQIYFYNFPQMTGLTIPVEVITALAAEAPERFTGIKDSSGDIDYARAIVAANPALKVFPSSETVLDTARAEGFAGCISASVNITGPLAARVWAAPMPEESALLSQQRAALAGPTLVAGIKAMIAERTGAPAWRAVLPPFIPFTAEDGGALAARLAAL